VFRGDENESITLIQGVEKDAEDIFEDARRNGRQYAMRHFIISPAAETTRAEMMQIVHDLAKEFGFDIEAAVIVEHEKPRFGEEKFDRHWHVLIPDWHDGDGRVVDTSFNFPRQEKIARLAEWRLGHAFVQGAHHEAVVSALKRDGYRQAALALSAAFAQPKKSRSAFSHGEAQRAKRFGADLPLIKAICRDAWRATRTALQLRDYLQEHELFIEIGDGHPAVWVVRDLDGNTLLRVTKAAHVSKAEVIKRLGDPNGRKSNEPRRAIDRWDRDPESNADRDPGDDRGIGSLAIEPNGRDSEIGPRAFLEGLSKYANRIEAFASEVEREAAPKSVRLDETSPGGKPRPKRRLATLKMRRCRRVI
jgi:hypothetical protein